MKDYAKINLFKLALEERTLSSEKQSVLWQKPVIVFQMKVSETSTMEISRTTQDICG